MTNPTDTTATTPITHDESCEPLFSDTRDFTDADRGHIASLTPCIIKTADGRICWDNDSFSFLDTQPCPPETANPKLWRQGQLNAKQGLYEVVPDAVYQLRGFDLSVMTVIEGATGLIIVDPLVSCECAAAALALYRQHRPTGPGGTRKEVVGMLYTHSHGDHYMGALGVLPEWDTNQHQQQATYPFPIVAPEGFIEAVMSESILAGPAMRRRAAYMYGRALPRNAQGHIGVGLAQASSTGTTSLVPPNTLVQRTGEHLTIDGVRFVFQMVPGSEAPAEFNFYLPDHRALCMAETATNCLHNIVTLRGAQVRDAKAWSRYLDEAMVLFCSSGDDDDDNSSSTSTSSSGAQTLFQSHHWPLWGSSSICSRLSAQRDTYGYIHDQTVRLMNLGLTGIEIAEQLQLPPSLRRQWHTQGYYGSVSHNVKGVYQKYMTWFDGRAESLWTYPPAEEGRRFVECLGGIEALCVKAEGYVRQGDLRFACTLLGHARAAFPQDGRVRGAMAPVLEALGYGAENATWRNFYLTAAQDLKTGRKLTGMIAGGGVPLGPSLTVDQWWDVLSVQLDGELAARMTARLVIDVRVTDVGGREGGASVGVGQKWRVMMSNGVLTHRRLDLVVDGIDAPGGGAMEGKPNLDLVMTKAELLEGLRGKDVQCERKEGRLSALKELLALTAVTKGSKRGPSRL